MAQSIGVVCDPVTGQPMQVEMRGLAPNRDILRGVLSVRPGGMVVFEQLNVQPVIAETEDAADFRVRTDEEIHQARTAHDTGLAGTQLATVTTGDLAEVAQRRTVPAAEQPAPVPPAPTPPPLVPTPPPPPEPPAAAQGGAEGEEQPGLEVAGPPQPPAPPAVQELVTKS